MDLNQVILKGLEGKKAMLICEHSPESYCKWMALTNELIDLTTSEELESRLSKYEHQCVLQDDGTVGYSAETKTVKIGRVAGAIWDCEVTFFNLDKEDIKRLLRPDVTSVRVH